VGRPPSLRGDVVTFGSGDGRHAGNARAEARPTNLLQEEPGAKRRAATGQQRRTPVSRTAQSAFRLLPSSEPGLVNGEMNDRNLDLAAVAEPFSTRRTAEEDLRLVSGRSCVAGR
jgi:hypothetical protein